MESAKIRNKYPDRVPVSEGEVLFFSSGMGVKATHGVSVRNSRDKE